MTLHEKIKLRREEFVNATTMPPGIALDLLEQVRKESDEHTQAAFAMIEGLNTRLLRLEANARYVNPEAH